MKKYLIACSLLALSFTQNANAILYSETGDAGETLDTAQMLGAGIDSITGSLISDADLFGFNWGGGLFEVDTQLSSIDTQLFLFDSTGAGVWANDDTYGLQSRLFGDLAAGVYYLGISTFNYDPVDAGGNLIFPSDWSGQHTAYDTDPLAFWSGGTSDGLKEYTISFIGGMTAASVPEPGSVMLLGLGLAGLGLARRRSQRS